MNSVVMRNDKVDVQVVIKLSNISNEKFLSEKLKCIAQEVSKRMTDEKLQRR